MSGARILVADDDEMIVDALQYQLRREGYEVLAAFDGAHALALARSGEPDLILLDVMMPVLQGWEVCQALRRESSVPILMLTARSDEMDRVLGLELGADDYITKPFSFRELLARIRANLRRVSLDHSAATEAWQNSPEVDEQVVRLGPVTIDRNRYRVLRDGVHVHLSNREFQLLLTLLDAGGSVIRRGDLLDQVWGGEWIGDPRTLDVHVRGLREKLEPDTTRPQLILTVRGVGYRLVTANEIPENG